MIEEDTDVSGAMAVSVRKLERLIQRVEARESEGIITPYLDRFGRDLIEGALAYRRLKLAEGRLICVNDGIDSDRSGDEFQFQIRMVFAEDYLRRTRSNFQAAVERASARFRSGAPSTRRRPLTGSPRSRHAGNEQWRSRFTRISPRLTSSASSRPYESRHAVDELGPICEPADCVAVARALRQLLGDLEFNVFLAEHLPSDRDWSAWLGGKVLRTLAAPT